jgi:hypothetical protein
MQVDSNLPTSGGLFRMEESFEHITHRSVASFASFEPGTPRPGAVVSSYPSFESGTHHQGTSFASFETNTPRPGAVDFEANTPRQGTATFEADTHHNRSVIDSFAFLDCESPSKKRRIPRKHDTTVYCFATCPKISHQLKMLHKKVETGTDISERDFQLLSSAMNQNYIRMLMGPRQTNTDQRRLIEKLQNELLEIQKSISGSMDSQEIESLKKQQKEKQTFLAALRTVMKEKVVPHHARIHPTYFNKFRDVLNPTSDRVYVSTNALMKQVSDDICDFLTSPLKLENRRRVVQQIWNSRPK